MIAFPPGLRLALSHQFTHCTYQHLVASIINFNILRDCSKERFLQPGHGNSASCCSYMDSTNQYLQQTKANHHRLGK